VNVLLLTLAALASDHAAHQARFGSEPHVYRPPPRGALPAPTPGPAMTVYGYLAYWDDDLSTVPWDDLTHLALFSVGANSDGSLGPTGNWAAAGDALALGAPYGVKIHLCITQFEPSYIASIISSPSNRAALIDALADQVAATGAHGVNVDFEGLPVANKQDMVDFTRELDAAVDEVVLATPAVDWSGAWDYSELSKYADLFIMGYGYHWSGSSEAGPGDPLYSGAGTEWASQHSLSWTVDDYLYWGSVPERTILGLPLYGHWYGTSGESYPATALTDGETVFYDDAWVDVNAHGRLYDAGSVSPYFFDGAGQTWYGDTDTVRERVIFARDSGIGGVGFWALNYVTDVAFWDMVGTEAGLDPVSDPTTPTCTEPGDPPAEGDPALRADAGQPFLAYVGDTVILSGLGSTTPSGPPVAYEWTQVMGPTVGLDADAAEPSFVVEQPGNLTFELRVSDGTDWSAPARSYVVIIDPAAGERWEQGGGCTSFPGAVPWLAIAGVSLLTRRRGRARA
jgi:hypothetical protein